VNIPASPATTGAPVVNQALEPKWVRDGSPDTQKAYQAALSFEQTLVEQLAHSLTTTSGLGGESSTEGEAGGEEGGSSMAGSGELSSTLPQALASGVMSAGGLGLAAQLTRGLEAAQGAAPAQSTGASGTAVTGGPASQSIPAASGLTSPGAAMGATGGAAAADTGGTGA
jgi:hypothetical protein